MKDIGLESPAFMVIWKGYEFIIVFGTFCSQNQKFKWLFLHLRYFKKRMAVPYVLGLVRLIFNKTTNNSMLCVCCSDLQYDNYYSANNSIDLPSVEKICSMVTERQAYRYSLTSTIVEQHKIQAA
ncbi:hypothetical protein CEXT_701291 [Caerostris extrusa]|uniref:Uncharacterized protein n=1 Tax=Caerostris extrusa TaxID=172846 RepID=A0AAV4MAC7_CAEEX|nr:hypothetical protein CEXT_701291 [Caerostris extrusa]